MLLSTRPILLIAISISLFASANSTAAPVDLWRADSIVSPAWNFEMLIGDSLAPVAVFRNVSLSPQSFACRFRIFNVRTGLLVYQDTISAFNVDANTSRRLTFHSYRTFPMFDEQAGAMLCEALAGPLQRDSAANPDTQRADDTLRELFFVIKSTGIAPFSDFNNYFTSTNLSYGVIPDAARWENHGTHVVSGDSASLLPPPPNGLQGDPSNVEISSPVIKFNRRDIDEHEYDVCSAASGDTLISLPVNMIGAVGARLVFSYERGGKGTDSGGFSSLLAGPERTITTPDGNVIRDGDRLVVEFADPQQQINITKWTEMWSSDGGADSHFNRVAIRIDSPYTTQNFRFRFRLIAKNDGIAGLSADDDDAWFVDNVLLSVPSQLAIECSYSRIAPSFAYTHLPARQASGIPLEVSLFNNGCPVNNMGPPPCGGSDVVVFMSVLRAGTTSEIYQTVYWLSQLPTDSQALLHRIWMTDQDGRSAGESGTGNYIVTTSLRGDALDDSSASTVTITLDSAMGYDDGANDVAQQSATPGLGLNLPPSSHIGGDGLCSTSTGSIAMKFQLSASDTVRSAMIWFGGIDTSATPLEIKLYQSAGDHPGMPLADPCASLITHRSAPWDRYRLYKFDCPVALDAGDYWLGVTQTAVGALELGGCASRSGCEWEVYDSTSAQAHVITPVHPELADKFAWEDSANSGRWSSFYPSHGFPAFGTQQNLVKHDTLVCAGRTVTRTGFANEGSWIPMLAPYFGTADAVGIISAAPQSPALILQTYPNPFSTNTTITFNAAADEQYAITITDVLGRTVRTIARGVSSANHRMNVTWDGKDDFGLDVPAGMYFGVLKTGAGRREIMMHRLE